MTIRVHDPMGCAGLLPSSLVVPCRPAVHTPSIHAPHVGGAVPVEGDGDTHECACMERTSCMTGTHI
ncbi:hypothetical protein IF2G_08313 [Cordyceps javanica]|nr:hypothetical protein IF2G_08313 [Cordyceps javanica]